MKRNGKIHLPKFIFIFNIILYYFNSPFSQDKENEISSNGNEVYVSKLKNKSFVKFV